MDALLLVECLSVSSHLCQVADEVNPWLNDKYNRHS
jgi:hypothetical protein